MKTKITVCLLAAMFILFCFTPSIKAFDGNDYNGGYSGGSSNGGYSGGYSSDWYSSRRYSSSRDSSSDGSWSLWVCLIFFVFMANIKKLNNKSTKQKNNVVRRGSNAGLHIRLPVRTVQIENMIKERDVHFSANNFISFVKRVYIDISDFETIRDDTVDEGIRTT